MKILFHSSQVAVWFTYEYNVHFKITFMFSEQNNVVC